MLCYFFFRLGLLIYFYIQNTKNTQLSCLVSQCKTSSCSCSIGRISCSKFGDCRNKGYRNTQNMIRDDDDDDDSDNDDSDDKNNE